jgi:subtilase family serine protease
VQTWLEQQGFSIDSVGRSKNMIRFSGTAGQVEQAFQTQMHYFNVGGEKHLAPSTDLSLPAAIAPVVESVRNIDNFKPRSMHIRGNGIPPRPDFTSGVSGSVFLAPGDIEVIYDMNPLRNNAFNGSGQTIAVMGQSAIVVSDVEHFQEAAGLTVKDPTQVLVPGSGTAQTFSGDEGESDLDLEWSGAMAPGASIYFVYTGNSQNNGVFDSISYAVDQKIGDIISVSYGACETVLGGFSLESTFQQAAAQGQTIVAAAGDSGSTACFDYGTLTIAQQQALAVNYPASSPYVTAMGGTEISQSSQAYYSAGQGYWKAETPGSDILTSALQYIPEVVWNDSSISAPAGYGLSATGGGASALFTKPSWQTGVPGIPADGKRDLPDISLLSSPEYVPYLFCTSDTSDWGSGQLASCNSGFRDSSTQDLTLAGGTSFATPIFAGMLAILNQQKGYGGGAGLINPALYKLASNSSTYASAFHDITSGNNECPSSINTSSVIYCSSTSGAESNYSAGVGYDLATGLGSIDLNNLATGSTATAAPAMTVTPTPTSMSVNQTLSVAVTLTGSSGTPTGTVVLSGGGYTSATETLAGGAYTFSVPAYSLSGGTDTLTVSYSGDSNYGVDSGTTTVTVTKLASSLTVVPGASSISSNAALTVTGSVSGSGPAPTGTVTLSGGGYTSSATNLSSGGYSVTIPANSLAVGADTLTVNYSGDGNYTTSSNSAGVTVTQSTAPATFQLTASSPASVNRGSSASSTITVGSTSGYSGTVTLTCTLNSGGPTNQSGDSPTCSIPSAAVGVGGTASATVSTVAATNAAASRPVLPGRTLTGAGGAVFALLVFLGIPARRRSWQSMLGILILLIAFGGLSACGGGGGSSTGAGSGTSNPGTASGTYTFTVTGTGNPAVTPAPTTAFTVTVN